MTISAGDADGMGEMGTAAAALLDAAAKLRIEDYVGYADMPIPIRATKLCLP